MVAITTETQKAQQLILWPGAHWVPSSCSQLSIWHLLWCISKVPQILLFRTNSCKAHLWSLLLLFHLLPASPTGRGWNHPIFSQTFMFHWMSAPFICLWEMSSISFPFLTFTPNRSHIWSTWLPMRPVQVAISPCLDGYSYLIPGHFTPALDPLQCTDGLQDIKKLTQYCKAIILQLKIHKFKKYL